MISKDPLYNFTSQKPHVPHSKVVDTKRKPKKIGDSISFKEIIDKSAQSTAQYSQCISSIMRYKGLQLIFTKKEVTRCSLLGNTLAAELTVKLILNRW